MTEDFLWKVFLSVKELFEQKENPLYAEFYTDYKTGFESFKKHANGDVVFKMVIDGENLPEERIRPMAIYIMGQIDRMYYMSGQGEKN